jgi:plasmid maintenance system antidote protein VapI
MPAALFGHTTSLRMNLEKAYDQKEREGKRKFGYGRLRGLSC